MQSQVARAVQQLRRSTVRRTRLLHRRSIPVRRVSEQEVWRATQQKWWYEVAKGNVESRAKLCSTCRRIERERRSESRRVHLEGIAEKLATKRAL